MPLQKCGRCSKLYFKVNTPVCEECLTEEEGDYARIRAVLESGLPLDAHGVAEAAEVSVDCVLRMLRDGRIEAAAERTVANCGRCGAPAISASKRLCQACLVKLDQECAESLREMKQKMSGAANVPVHEVRQVLDAKRGLLPEPDRARLADKSAAKQRMAIQERIREKRGK